METELPKVSGPDIKRQADQSYIMEHQDAAYYWKTGLICPLPKPGNNELTKNWRPIVHCVELIHVQYYGHSQQYVSLVELDTFISDARSRKRHVAIVMTDICAAFNIIKKEVLTSNS